MKGRKIRVVIAKPGLDGHDMGAKVVALALKEEGMEVIYTGLHRTVDQIVSTALQEDADVVGVSIYSGAHLPLCKKLMEAMAESGLSDKIMIVGGNIPKRDIATLKGYGVTEVFSTGSRLDDIITFIKNEVGETHEKA